MSAKMNEDYTINYERLPKVHMSEVKPNKQRKKPKDKNLNHSTSTLMLSPWDLPDDNS